jgi:SAM-dependent methyltransferase
MQNVNGQYADIELQMRIIKELGYSIGPNSKILDFGCGNGARVYDFRKMGFDAFGVDIKLDEEDEFLRVIPANNGYRIPFNDETFDYVYSNQVFEHVRDHKTALSEIRRVLKPRGFSLHFFPPKFRPIECHTGVPLGGMIQEYSWLLLWAFLGVRIIFQKGMKFTDVAERNSTYLRRNTCYLTKNDIRLVILTCFNNVTFAEKYFIKHSYGRARYIYPFVNVFPLVASLFSTFHQRVVFFSKD